MPVKPTDPVRGVSCTIEPGEVDGPVVLARKGARLSFAFDQHEGDTHHTVIREGATRRAVADQLRFLAVLIEGGGE